MSKLVIIRAENATQLVRASIQDAMDFGYGSFTNIIEIAINDHDNEFDNTRSESQIHNDGVAAANEHHADWIFFLHGEDILNPETFVSVQPYLDSFDAIWGAASQYGCEDETKRVIKKSRLACQNYEGFFHLSLQWWIGRSHFIRTDIAKNCSYENEDWGYQNYLLPLWQSQRCIKTTQAYTAHQQELPDLSDSERDYLLEHLDKNPVYIQVQTRNGLAKLPYTGRNPVIERKQTNGVFFEHNELDFLANRLPDDCTIVDIGANTGNHTIYFSMNMNPARVIPLEPAPRSISALRKTVAFNGLKNVDLSKLGIGVSDTKGTGSLKLSARSGLGATQVEDDSQGDIQLLPIDDIIEGRIDFIKIDVESMEMKVLEGAKRLIHDYSPFIFIEIIDKNIDEFMHWVNENNYQIEKIFPEKSYANYFLSPIDSHISAQMGERHD